ncbi:hypothetical protein CDD83_247 [Cordyceps sp. RAO-2017]|nr:hypothetical protein CDD83_247 [Cordyceps sp. RAO-2017]
MKNIPAGMVGLVLMAVSIMFLWWVILSGVTSSTPIRHVYFLRADTSGIDGARDVSQWNYWFICGYKNRDCGDTYAAPPFGYAWNANANNVPDGLGGRHGHHTTSYHMYYMWRFGWVFLLMTLFFEHLALFASLVACCGRLGAAVASFMCYIALFWYTLAVSIITAVFCQARHRFHRAGRSARIGAWCFGFLWASYAGLLFASILFSFGIRRGKEAAVATGASRGRTGGGMWRRRSNRSQSYDGRRVKEEYS